MCVFMTFQDHLCPFSMSFQDCLIEWVSNESDFHIHVLNQVPYAHSSIQARSPTKMWNRNGKMWSSELKNVESKITQHVHGSDMRQPFGLFSMTFQDLGLIP